MGEVEERKEREALSTFEGVFRSNLIVCLLHLVAVVAYFATLGADVRNIKDNDERQNEIIATLRAQQEQAVSTAATQKWIVLTLAEIKETIKKLDERLRRGERFYYRRRGGDGNETSN